MLKVKFGVALVGAAVIASLSGCASTTPTVTSKTAYVVYDAKGDSSITYQKVMNAFVSGSKEYLTNANVQENPPPYPLPEKPGRFQSQQMSDMQGMGSVASLMALGGAAVPNVVSCHGASARITGNDNSFSGYGKSAVYTFCLYPYQGGYQINVISTYTSQSGFVADPAVLGAQLAGAIVGSPSKFIEKTFGNEKAALESAGLKVTVVDSFDPFSSN